MARNIDLNPVSAVTTGAIGQPGQRVFYLQARRGPTTITIETEKEQVRALALGIHQFLEELTQRFPDRTDLAKGFIRAEVVAYPDLIELGGLDQAKHKGKFRLEGKEYIVKDGDIVHIRHNM